MAALVIMNLRIHWVFLPATVVAEFVLNSLIPPPDTVEEEKTNKRANLISQQLVREPSLVKVNSKQDIS